MITKWIYFDIDGTLTCDGFTISNRTALALQYLKSKQIKIGIVTGRSLFLVDYFIRFLKTDLPTICANGSWIVNSETLQTIHTSTIDTRAQSFLLEWFINDKLDFLVYTIEGIYTNNIAMPFYERLQNCVKNAALNGIKSSLTYEDKVTNNPFFYQKQRWLKVIICYQNIEDKIRYTKILDTVPFISHVTSENGIIEIFNNQVNKGKGINFVLSNKRVNKRDILVFGDSENDIDMFKIFYGSCVAMANAFAPLKEIATYITDFDCNQEGVADFIFKNF